MNSILTELYEAFKPGLMSPEEREVLMQESEIIEKVERQLSSNDFDNLWAALSHLNAVQAEESFALGFRLGVRLMLEAASPNQ